MLLSDIKTAIEKNGLGVDDYQLVVARDVSDPQLDFVIETKPGVYAATTARLIDEGTVIMVLLKSGEGLPEGCPAGEVTYGPELPEVERQPFAERVIDFLSDRKGFDHWWDNIDDDIQEEIIRELDEMVPA